MPSVGFEPTVSAGERPQTNALGRAATWTGTVWTVMVFIYLIFVPVHHHNLFVMIRYEIFLHGTPFSKRLLKSQGTFFDPLFCSLSLRSVTIVTCHRLGP